VFQAVELPGFLAESWMWDFKGACGYGGTGSLSLSITYYAAVARNSDQQCSSNIKRSLQRTARAGNCDLKFITNAAEIAYQQ
jgi:hypothetical protein